MATWRGSSYFEIVMGALYMYVWEGYLVIGTDINDRVDMRNNGYYLVHFVHH